MSSSQDHDHDYYREMLGAYALDALVPDGQREMEAHLATCAECQQELAILQMAVLAMPLASEEQEPPADLRSRIVAAAAATISPATDSPNSSETPEPHRPVSANEPGRPPRGEDRIIRPRWRTILPWAAAAVFLLFALAMLGWNLSLHQSGSSASQLATIGGTSAAPNVQGQITYLKSRQVMILSVRDLPALKPGDVYQIWLIHGQTPVPVGVFGQTSTSFAISANPSRYQALAVTIEPGPLGSPAPTGAKVVVSELSSS